MNRIEQVNKQRDDVLEQLRSIRSLKKGNLNEQWFPVVRNGKKTEKLRGPYYVWSYKVGKKTVSERISSDVQLRQGRQDVANYKKFRELCSKLEQLTNELGELERPESQEVETLKKGLKSKSKRIRK